MFPSAFRAAALAATLVLASVPARAQEPSPSHLAAAREFMQTIAVLTPVDDLIPGFLEQIRRQTVTRPELTKDLNEIFAALQPELQLQRQQVTGIVARTYAKWLSEPELKELTAFFKTPLGAKYNRIQPELVEDMLNDIKVWTDQASEYVMVRVRAELAKRGHQLQ